MKLGTGKKSDNGGLRFDLDIPGLVPFPFELEKNSHQGERGPDWVAVYRGERFGAFWKKIPNGGGDPFLSGHLESPIFPGGRLEVAVFSSKDVAGQKDLVWSVRHSGRSSATEHPAATGSTGTASAPPAGGDDDDIPF